ncbi:MFS transporter [Ideonella sp. B7]|uniref:MFS transporter n=1 Tax=Ideonella benzenivorans TaxID=2831643 RepID=UPI001CEC2AF5|nr:MFS transporter [Ideonella benzenivorans]MCA6215025.1 MFS transporter [Ideonella benzenivorans]
MPTPTAPTDALAPTVRPSAPPWIFMVLIVPFGLVGGFLGVALAYELKQAGVSAAAIAGLIALSYVPNTWKFFWAPLVDLSWTRRHWYLASTLVTALGMVGMAWFSRDALHWGALTVVMLITNVTSTVSGMAVDSLMAHSTADEEKGRAAGWFQAGNLGGGALGGGLALWLVQDWQVSVLASGWLMAALCGLSCLPLLLLAEPAKTPHDARASHASGLARLKGVAWGLWGDLWSVVSSRAGGLALLVCFLPIGSGAASNLWSVMAGDWQASANTVALVNGGLGGVASAAGCLIGGWVCDRLERKWAYCLFGALQVLLAVAMAEAPHTEASFVVLSSAYNFAVGMAYAGFSALVLEVIGRGAAATKYNLMASLSNIPIGYVTWIDGLSYERWGARAMLNLEALIGVLGLLCFALAAHVVRSRSRRQGPPLTAP